MGKGTGRENRRTPRRVFARLVGVLFRGQYKICLGRQISEGGISFEVELPLQPSDQVLVTVLLPDGGHAIARTEIVHRYNGETEPVGIFGLKFLNLPLAQRRVIRNYVAAKTQEEAELELGEYNRGSGKTG